MHTCNAIASLYPAPIAEQLAAAAARGDLGHIDAITLHLVKLGLARPPADASRFAPVYKPTGALDSERLPCAAQIAAQLSRTPATMNELADLLGLPHSTVQRYVNMAEEEGVIKPIGTREPPPGTRGVRPTIYAWDQL